MSNIYFTVPITVNESYTNLRLGDIVEYDCTLDYFESGVIVQWNTPDTTFSNPLTINVNQSISNTKYTCTVNVTTNPLNCKQQRKDILLTVRGKICIHNVHHNYSLQILL